MPGSLHQSETQPQVEHLRATPVGIIGQDNSALELSANSIKQKSLAVRRDRLQSFNYFSVSVLTPTQWEKTSARRTKN